MSSDFKKTLNKHVTVKGLVVWSIMMVLTVSMLRLGFDGVAWAAEGFADKEHWYIYHSVELVTNGVPKGDVPKFVTDSTYFNEIDVRWEDTLWCRQSEGIKKYPIQRWPDDGGYERQPTGNTIQRHQEKTGTDTFPFWEYTQAPIDEDATECKLEWRAIGITSRGHEKIWTGTVNWFKVNI